MYDDAGNKSVEHTSLNGLIRFLPNHSNVEQIPYSISDSGSMLGGYVLAGTQVSALGNTSGHLYRDDCYTTGWFGERIDFSQEYTWSFNIQGSTDAIVFSFELLSHSRHLSDGYENKTSYHCHLKCRKITSGSYRTHGHWEKSQSWGIGLQYNNSWSGDIDGYMPVYDACDVGGTNVRTYVAPSVLPTQFYWALEEAKSVANSRAPWSVMTQEAVESSHNWGNNMLALIRDITHLHSDVSSLAKTASDFGQSLASSFKGGSKAQAVKDGASLYLGNKYGYGLTVADCWSVGQTLNSLRKQPASMKYGVRKLRSRKELSWNLTYGTWTVNYSLLARVGECDSVLMDLIERALSWDIYPTLGNMWDFVPYSFVIDWLVDVGGVLESIDARVNTLYLPLKSLTKSEKITSPFISPTWCYGQDASGSLELTYYRRWPQFEWDHIVPSLQPGSGLDGHFLESASLIIQRINVR